MTPYHNHISDFSSDDSICPHVPTYHSCTIEKALKKFYPNANIARIDRDTTQRKNSMNEIITKIKEGKLDIIIGTQMITKGHHFSNITLAQCLILLGPYTFTWG